MTIRRLLATLNLNCRRAARLLSDAGERPLTRAERFGLSAHLLGCRSCRRYRDQLQLLSAALRPPRRPDDARLSAEARARITRSLDAAGDPPR